MGDWLTFDQMWKANQEILKSGCSSLEAELNKPEDIQAIHDAVVKVAEESKLEPSFILAEMLQESLCCVRVKTTEYSHKNPGLMQSYMGTGTCVQKAECPASTILQMVKDGVTGTAQGPGLLQNYGDAKGTGAQKYYRASRLYNSGSVPASGDLGAAGATECYCSDIANRLIGFANGDSQCTLNT